MVAIDGDTLGEEVGNKLGTAALLEVGEEEDGPALGVVAVLYPVELEDGPALGTIGKDLPCHFFHLSLAPSECSPNDIRYSCPLRH